MMEPTKRARTTAATTSPSGDHVTRTTSWSSNMPTACELRSFGLEGKAEALATARHTWFADMTKWREQAFEHIEAHESRGHMQQKQKNFRRQMLHLSK
ncbi:hypothetical protein DYB37_005186 [Aphanomyces astaci]|uniref:Uncharacterized protein n=1 Tax=Aphanomyces astaci TaxID=112090 RepID=A0A397E2T9_APHAT|nr:hypothetical protein AaE_012072 [Aphanomyces astaci]RHY15356.1 hypothetical protein DYB25_009409 [Aphanomyces astaci]RHY54958.1 hypothetical protein DYB38_010252 [Aphanomyces astaci]RHY74691.1 hypothetical protein DYB30_007634 [Aphanomyces astaci]RHY76828.1 hypothetical protein DYB34_004685 [Aphanomyces astaci]